MKKICSLGWWLPRVYFRDREEINYKRDGVHRSLLHFKKEELRNCYVCSCCSFRLTASSCSLLKGKSIRLFVVTHQFPNLLSADAHICTNCRIIYNKWITLPEFCELLQTINSCHEIVIATINKADDKSGDIEECTNGIPGETGSMDSVSDNESFEESSVNGQIEDEEMAFDESNMDASSVWCSLFSSAFAF